MCINQLINGPAHNVISRFVKSIGQHGGSGYIHNWVGFLLHRLRFQKASFFLEQLLLMLVYQEKKVDSYFAYHTCVHEIQLIVGTSKQHQHFMYATTSNIEKKGIHLQ